MANQPEDKIITFESYYDPMLAHIIRTKLEDNGIQCFIADENTIGANPLYNQAVGGVKLKIFERDLQKCKDILAEEGDLHDQDHFEIDEDTDNVVICPYCASTNVSYGVTSQKNANWFSSLFSSLFFPFTAQKDWHCFNCHRDFE